MKRILFILTMAITAFFGVMVHGQTIPTGQPQRVQHPYYQYDGFIEAKGGILLPRRVANFTPKSPALIYDTVTGKVSVYLGGWKSLQNVAFTADYNDLINRPDLTQYVPTSRTINGYSLTSNITINNVDIGLGNVQNVDVTNAGNITSGTLSDARLSANVTLQGNTFNGANQLLQLDAGGKVAYANLPAALMIYKGVWDASSNTPTLTDGTGVNGWVYRVHPGGTVNFGSGSITFTSGDYVIYNGSVWQKSGGGDAVTSVNGQQGVVVLSTANIAEGGTNYYYTNTRVQTYGDTRYSLLNHEHVYSDIANLSSYTGFDVRYKSISYVPAWSDITGKPTFATVATSGAYSDLSGTPSLGSLAALSTIGNAYITDIAWSKITGPPSFLTTETDPTIYAWAKASVKPSYTYAEIGGTVPTWNQNTTGNATTATQWGANGWQSDGGFTASPVYVITYDGTDNKFRVSDLNGLKSWFGLGSYAYRSSGLAELTGATFTGGIAATGKVYAMGTGTNTGLTLASTLIYEESDQSFNITIPGSFPTVGLKMATTTGATTFFSTVTAGGSMVVPSGFGFTSGGFQFGGITSNRGFVYNTATGRDAISINASTDIVTIATSLVSNGYMNSSSYQLGGVNALTYSGTTVSVANNSFWQNLNLVTNGSTAISINNSQVVTVANYLTAGYLQASGATGLLVLTNSSWGNSEIRNNTEINGGAGGDYMAFKNPAGKGFTWTVGGYSVANLSSAGALVTAAAITAIGGVYFTNTSARISSNGSGSLDMNYSTGGTPVLNWYGGGVSSKFAVDHNGNGGFSGNTTANSFIKSGGTSSQFLKADGSVDANTYVTSAVTTIAGTTNQIAVSASTGAVTVSLTSNVVIPGTFTSSASFESSDRRLKRELTGTRLIGRIESLQARFYEKDGRDEYGYYAQDALAIIPTAVKQRADGYYDLSYTQVFVVKIASLEKRVLELEKLLEKIYAR